MKTEQAYLGLATTKELLLELQARFEVNQLTDNYNVTENIWAKAYIDRILDILPDNILYYKTVDNH